MDSATIGVPMPKCIRFEMFNVSVFDNASTVVMVHPIAFIAKQWSSDRQTECELVDSMGRVKA